MKTFSTELVNSFADNNYFGQLPDTSEEEQKAIREAWIENMRKRSWILDESIIENDKEYLGEVVDLWLEFERDGDKALAEVCEHLAGAF